MTVPRAEAARPNVFWRDLQSVSVNFAQTSVSEGKKAKPEKSGGWQVTRLRSLIHRR